MLTILFPLLSIYGIVVFFCCYGYICMNRTVVDLDGVGFVDHAVYRILGGDDDGQAVAGRTGSMEDLAGQLAAVQRSDVVEAAQTLTLDTVYFLKGVQG